MKGQELYKLLGKDSLEGVPFLESKTSYMHTLLDVVCEMGYTTVMISFTLT